MCSNLDFLVLIFLAFVRSEYDDDLETQFNEFKSYANDFSMDFYKHISEADKNIIFSPLSTQIAIASLSLGAQGETLKEINAGLHLPDTNFTKSVFTFLVDDIEHKKEGSILRTANKIFVTDAEGYEIDPEFKGNAIDIFASDVQSIDFKDPSQNVATINSWVEEKTDKNIKNIIKEAMMTPLTRLIIVNAIHFEGKWSLPFSKTSTRDMNFYSKNQKFDVKMMLKLDTFPFAELQEWNAKAVELKFKFNEMSMVIILPNEMDGLSSVESHIKSGNDLIGVFKKLKKNHERVALRLPRFKIESDLSLMTLLMKLNIKQMFTNNAELDGVTKNKKHISVSSVIQKAIIEINEKGTVADNSTEMSIFLGFGLAVRQPTPFLVDHPFIFCLKTKRNIPVLIGKYYGPNN